MDSLSENCFKMVKPPEPSCNSVDSQPKSLSLSDALESLPLVYLPQTKQLVAVPAWKNPDDLFSANTSPSSSACISSSDFSNSEISFPDYPANNCSSPSENLDDSKFSEDSGVLGLRDANVGSAEESSSRRRRISSVEYNFDLEDTDKSEISSSCAKTSDCAFVSSPPSPVFKEVSSTSSSASIFTDVATTDDAVEFSYTDLVTKDLQKLSLSSCSALSNDCFDSCSSSSSIGNEVHRVDDTARPVRTERPKRGLFTSLITSTFFGGKGKNQQDSTVGSKTSCNGDSPAGNQSAGKAEQKQGPINRLSSPSFSRVFKKSDVEKSTTALILQERPQGLPTKDPEEEARHRHLYQVMVEEAKQKERKDAKRTKQKLRLQLKYEAATANALKTWNNEILPNWETVKNLKKVRDLWWNGIPPRIRGRVWQLAIGNELNITPELYEICVVRAKERLRILKDTGSDTDSLLSFTESSASRESSVELIRLDVSRTFPNLCIFQKGGPYHELLQSLLGSYACYRPDVGYVQGMSFIAAMLLLNLEVAEAFICFANLLNKPCLLAFFRLDRPSMDSYFEAFSEFFCENLPRLHQHMLEINVTPDLYILDWLFTLYTKSLSLDIVSRVWDVYFRDGEEFLFRTALGILKMYEDILLNLDFIQLAQFLTRLPSNVSCDDLFRYIETISMEIDKRQFAQVLSQHRESSSCQNV